MLQKIVLNIQMKNILRIKKNWWTTLKNDYYKG